jgi:D-alanine-D-alanine ligase-like ATP-grasp enzyme
MTTYVSPYSEKLMFAALRMKNRLGIMMSRLWGRKRTVYVWDRVPFYRQIWEAAAARLGARFSELAEGIWEVRRGEAKTYINIHRVQLDDAVIDNLAGNKPFCYDVMRREKIPVPDHVIFRPGELDRAWQFLNRRKSYCVVKPALETGAGMGVTTYVRSKGECRNAIALASLYSSTIILEDIVPGECYRLLVLNGRMIHAVRRRGVRVRGDGRTTIDGLVKRENELRRERKSTNDIGLIAWNRDMAATLSRQGLTFQSVPLAGREVLVQSHDRPGEKHVEVRTIYNEVVTDLICQELRQQAERAACLLHSKFTGVDVITLDPSVPLEQSGGVINEINSNPGMHHHYISSSHNAYNHSDDIQPAVSVLAYLLDQNGRTKKEEGGAVQAGEQPGMAQ